MIWALTVFGFYLLLSAIVLSVFWALQIRFGGTSDLDPDNLFVRFFAPKGSPQRLEIAVVQAVTGSGQSVGAVPTLTAIGTAAALAMLSVTLSSESRRPIPGAFLSQALSPARIQIVRQRF